MSLLPNLKRVATNPVNVCGHRTSARQVPYFPNSTRPS
jgi:hypothetical protein